MGCAPVDPALELSNGARTASEPELDRPPGWERIRTLDSDRPDFASGKEDVVSVRRRRARLTLGQPEAAPAQSNDSLNTGNARGTAGRTATTTR